MFRIDSPGSVAIMPTAATYGVPGFFAEVSSSNLKPTLVSADIMNTLMMEPINVILAAGLTLNKADNTQLLQALQHFIGAATLSFVPVQQGGAPNLGDNKLHLGWSTAGDGLRLQVDSTAEGYLVQSPTPAPNLTLPSIALSGSLTTTSIAASGSITAASVSASGAILGASVSSSGELFGDYARLSSGATGSADVARVTVLADFALTSGVQGVCNLPNGLVLQWGSFGAATGLSGWQAYNQPFSTACFNVTISYGASVNPTAGSIGADANTVSNFNWRNSAPAGGSDGVHWFAIGV